MIDKDAVEKALLLGIVRDKNWQILLLNSINKDYFSYANHKLYDYIKEYVDKNEYPELQLIGYKFEIDDQDMRDHLEITDLQGLCDTIKTEYLSGKIKQCFNDLNEHSDELNDDPIRFVERLGEVHKELK